MDAEKLTTFYKSRAKNPRVFTYSQDGDLIQKNLDGSVGSTIVLPKYRRPMTDEIIAMQEDFTKRVVVAGQRFEQEFKKLRNLIETNSSITEIINQGRVVESADKALQSMRFPIHEGYYTESVDINQVLFDQPYETRKMPTRIASITEHPFTLMQMYAREEGGRPVVAVVPPAVAAQASVPPKKRYKRVLKSTPAAAVAAPQT